MKKFKFIFLFFINFIKPESEYLFLQQYNDMCTIAPMINLKLLEEFIKKNNYNFDSLENKYWLSRREWFGKSFDQLTVWHESLNDAQKNVFIRSYLQDSVDNGPLLPHFYLKNNKNFFQGVQGAQKIAVWPYFLIDVNAARKIKFNLLGSSITFFDFNDQMVVPGVKLPIVLDNYDGYFKYYDKKTGKFEILGEELDLSDARLKIYSKYLKEEENFFYEDKETALGFDLVLGTKAIGGIYLNNKVYVPYMTGFYKILLLILGLNNDNEDITKKGPDYLVPVNKDFDKLFNKNSENPWSNNYFNKEIFLQYHLTEILKNNPELFKRLASTVDFYLKGWSCYNGFIKLVKDKKLYKSDGNLYQYEDIMKYLIGPEQHLAYLTTLSVRLLWYGASSSNASAFYKTSPKIPVFWTFEGFKKNAYKKNKNGDSFVSVWQELLQVFKKYLEINNIKRKNFFSFDNHGWVFSLDEKIIELQKKEIGKYKDLDINLFNDLQITGIESWNSSLLKTFYKRARV